jgi:hypothetical protein
VSFAAITLCVASQRVLIAVVVVVVVYFVMSQSGNIWIHPHKSRLFMSCIKLLRPYTGKNSSRSWSPNQSWSNRDPINHILGELQEKYY